MTKNKPNTLANKHFIMAVTGGIAAYKTATLIRLLVKQQATVQVLMTPFAKKFITPLTLATLSKRPVLTEFFNPENGQWNSHVELGLNADAFIVAPATANTIAKMAHGIADNLVLTSYLSARCPVFLAPAMDLDMLAHQATQQNLDILSQRGNTMINPEVGELASGLQGKGRMAEPETIVAHIEKYYQRQNDLAGKNILITAGPTQENIDPVRFIANKSSGKMGYAIAEEAAQRGATVNLVSGSTLLHATHKNIKVHSVSSANQMFEASKKLFPQCDIAIFTAAVADYRPEICHKNKIKKNDDTLTLKLVKNPDIAKTLSLQKSDKQFTVGFALESNNEQNNAIKKLKEKNFNLVVLNSINDKGAGFSFDTNKISIINQDNKIKHFQLKPKTEVAYDIWQEILKYI